jgi:hypothetical protein
VPLPRLSTAGGSRFHSQGPTYERPWTSKTFRLRATSPTVARADRAVPRAETRMIDFTGVTASLDPRSTTCTILRMIRDRVAR